ncbi:MAG: hypothetical protein J7K73_02925 [Nanoarchaeota archaeon]|nr:hypothetical protein [Nanoarchaeota archaeon]
MANYKVKRVTVRLPEEELYKVLQDGRYEHISTAMRDALFLLGERLQKNKMPNVEYVEIRIPKLLYNRAENAIASGALPAVNFEDAVLFLLRDYLRNVEVSDRNQKTLDDYAQE